MSIVAIKLRSSWQRLERCNACQGEVHACALCLLRLWRRSSLFVCYKLPGQSVPRGKNQRSSVPARDGTANLGSHTCSAAAAMLLVPVPNTPFRRSVQARGPRNTCGNNKASTTSETESTHDNTIQDCTPHPTHTHTHTLCTCTYIYTHTCVFVNVMQGDRQIDR